MPQQETLIRLRDIMKQSPMQTMDWDAVQPEDTIESLGFDSLSILDFLYDIQQEFSVKFEAEDVVDLKTVGQIANFIDSKTIDVKADY